MRQLGRLGHADMAIGPAELMAIFGVFAFAGATIGGTVGEILRPSAKFFFQLGGGLVGLILVKPIRGIRASWGYLGIAGAVLLAILVSCGTGSVGQIASLSRARSTANRLESGDNTILATGPARGCQIAINEFNLGLLSEKEMREQCGDSLAPAQGVEEGEKTALRIPKPSFLLFVWVGIQILLVVVVLVFIFRKPPP